MPRLVGSLIDDNDFRRREECARLATSSKSTTSTFRVSVRQLDRFLDRPLINQILFVVNRDKPTHPEHPIQNSEGSEQPYPTPRGPLEILHTSRTTASVLLNWALSIVRRSISQLGAKVRVGTRGVLLTGYIKPLHCCKGRKAFATCYDLGALQSQGASGLEHYEPWRHQARSSFVQTSCLSTIAKASPKSRLSEHQNCSRETTIVITSSFDLEVCTTILLIIFFASGH